MGTPSNPEVYDSITLVDRDGVERLFMVVYVDEHAVVCDSFSRMAHFTRDDFERLFEGDAE